MEAASAIHAIPIASFLEADHFASTFKRRTSLSSFLNDASYFFREWLRDVHTQSRFEGVEGDSLETSYNVLPELEFGAEVHILSEKEITVNVNLGVLFCLQDLALRACSAETFFNPHPGDHDFELAWQGSRCRAPLQTFPPRLRYWDYSTTGPQIDPRLFDIWQATGTTPKSSEDIPWIGRFIRKAPADPERLELAVAMMHVALTWIVLHEEAHFRQGHLLYRERSRREDPNFIYTPDMSRAFEFQADKDATDGVASIFFRSIWHQALPDYARRDWSWLMRFVSTAVGLAIIAMDIGRRRYGQVEYYPEPRTRWLTVDRHLYPALEIYCRRDLLQIDPYHGEKDFTGNLLRQQAATLGSLQDLTEIQQAIMREENIAPGDAMWPLEDAFPFVAARILSWGGTIRRDDPEFWSSLLTKARGEFTVIAREFGTTEARCESYLPLAVKWCDDLNALVDLSNCTYRPLTAGLRLWEKNR